MHCNIYSILFEIGKWEEKEAAKYAVVNGGHGTAVWCIGGVGGSENGESDKGALLLKLGPWCLGGYFLH